MARAKLLQRLAAKLAEGSAAGSTAGSASRGLKAKAGATPAAAPRRAYGQPAVAVRAPVETVLPVSTDAFGAVSVVSSFTQDLAPGVFLSLIHI